MHVTDLPINQAIGICLAPAGSAHLLELPARPLTINHVGTIHASVQFALAEACSGEFLLSQVGGSVAGIFAVLRASEVKFRKPARGALRASARFLDGENPALVTGFASRSRTMAAIHVEICDADGLVTMTGDYHWFLQRQDSSD
jgi:hypothetical protein